MIPPLLRIARAASLLALVRAPAAAQQPISRVPAASAARPALRVGTATGNLRLDGVLDEAAWSAADSIADLTQIEPVEGARATGRTVFRVLASGDALIIGIRADGKFWRQPMFGTRST